MSTLIYPGSKPRITAEMFMEAQNLRRDNARAYDAFTNALSRVGFGTSNLLEGTSYPLTRLTRNYLLIQSLYRSNWIIRKVIDGYAEDMVKNWITISSEVTPKKIDQFDKAVDDTGTQEAILRGLKWGRLFGGAGAVIMIDGVSTEELATPLIVEDVPLKSYRGLLVFDRWSGITPSSTIHTDLERPREFGLPESYRVTTESAKSFTVHSTRVLRFTGRDLPQWEWQAEQRWGLSEIEICFDELKKRDNTSWNIASLIFRANIVELKMKDLAQALSGLGKSAPALTNFYNTLSAQTQLMSNQGLMVTDPTEGGGLSTHGYSFGGINDIYVSFMLDMCGATEYPMSRLFGRSSSGLSGTNEGDEHSYYDNVGMKQKRELNPQFKKLFPVIAMSEWGMVPPDFDWQFPPVRTLSNEEQAELASKKVTAILEPFNAGLYGRQTGLKELKGLSEEVSLFSNITDKMIAAADDEVVSAVDEFAAMTENQPGDEDGGKAPKGGDDPNGKKEIPPNNKPKKARDSSTKILTKGPIVAYTKDHNFEGKWAGLHIVIENLPGTTRMGVNKAGQPWSVTMTYPYGYVEGTRGTDGDPVDCFLGPFEEVPLAFAIHTQDPLTGKADEDKVMLGWPDVQQALQAFFENYSSADFFRSVEAIPMKDLPSQLKRLRGKKLKAVDAAA